jgi:hypothetical protein
MNNSIQRVLETDENGIATIMIEREVSFKEAISIFLNRRLKEIVFVDVKECTQLNSEKQ